MFRSFCLCSCLVALVNSAALTDVLRVAPEGGTNLKYQASNGTARCETGGSVQGQLQAAGKHEYTGTDGNVDAVTHKTAKDGLRPSGGIQLQNSEVVAQVQQNGTAIGIGQKISEANQKGPAAAGTDDDDELVGDKIGSACLACLAGGGLG